MTKTNLTRKVHDASRRFMSGSKGWMLVCAGASALGGCVQVTAPERPIEINLNINISQEVIVRLRQDAQELIENNEGIF